MRFLGLARLQLALSARAAWPIAAPLGLGIVVVASILFGGNGMRAADAVRQMRDAEALHLGLFAAWLALSLPAARAAFTPRGSRYLRWLPAPRWLFWLTGGAALLAIELPWMVLFGRGEGIVAGLAAGLLAVAGHALLLGKTIHPSALATAVLIGVGLHFDRAAILAAPPAAALGIAVAFRRAPELGGQTRTLRFPRSKAPALGLAHLLGAARGEPASFARAIPYAALAGLSLPLVVRGYDLVEESSIGAALLVLAAVALPAGLWGIAAAVLRAELSAGWLLAATGTGPGTRMLAATGGTVAVGAALGLSQATIATAALGARPVLALRLLLLGLCAGAVTGAGASFSARRAAASPRRGDRSLGDILLWVALGLGAVALLGEASPSLLVFVAALQGRAARRGGSF
jgi:hypothetical protein